MATPSQNRLILDGVIGFFIPLGVFIEVGSPILLATSPIGQENFAFPLSLLLVPVALLRALQRTDKTRIYPQMLVFSALIFSVYCLVMSMASLVVIDPLAFVYGLQWAMVFIWLPYFSTLADQRKFHSFAKGFIYGTLVNLIYYLISGLYEIVFFGHLQDAGRMTQNLFLPGQYQIALSVPTIVAYSSIACMILINARIVDVPRYFILIILSLALPVLLFLAAREAVLVVLVFCIAWAFVRGGIVRIGALVAAFAFLIVILNPAPALHLLEGSEFRLLDKIMKLEDEDGQLGGRDTMLGEVTHLLENSPVFGTYFTPPNSGIKLVAIDAPSAHNMYVDAFVWSGLLGGILFLLSALSIATLAAKRVWQSYTIAKHDYLGRYFGILMLVFLFVSNNLNVPMRQPLLAPLIGFLIFVCSYWSSSAKFERKYAES